MSDISINIFNLLKNYFQSNILSIHACNFCLKSNKQYHIFYSRKFKIKSCMRIFVKTIGECIKDLEKKKENIDQAYLIIRNISEIFSLKLDN